jgi:(p)ppGpp synthase/HD superfamily hydrolase
MHLSRRFDDAVGFVLEKHRHQLRKGTEIPYVSHLLAVAAIVLEYGGTEDEAIAAVLHDVVEDQGGRPVLEQIRAEFGAPVADTVEGCTDAETNPRPRWRERKERYLEHLPGASASVHLVAAADKLHNLRAIIRDYRRIGEGVWSRFNSGRDGILWYHHSVLEQLKLADRAPSGLLDELESAVRELSEAAWKKQEGS